MSISPSSSFSFNIANAWVFYYQANVKEGQGSTISPSPEQIPFTDTVVNGQDILLQAKPDKDIFYHISERANSGAHLRCVSLRVRVPSGPMLSWKVNVLEIPLDKEFTANCLVETRTKLEELIPVAMVNYGLIGYSASHGYSSPWLNGFPWYGLPRILGLLWATVVGEYL